MDVGFYSDVIHVFSAIFQRSPAHLGLAALVADATVDPHAVEARVVDGVELRGRMEGGEGKC